MSKYKGGYILVDTTETMIDSTPKDLLSQELKNYIIEMCDIDGDGNLIATSELLMKPIIILCRCGGGEMLRIEVNSISDDLFALVGSCVFNLQEYDLYITLDNDLKIVINITPLQE